MTETEKTILTIQTLERAKMDAMKRDLGDKLSPYYLEFKDLKDEFNNTSSETVDTEVLLIALNTLENVFKILQKEGIEF